MSRIRRILHPTDFSRASRAGFGRALDLAKANRAELLIVHVRAAGVAPMAGEGYMSPQTYQEVEASLRAWEQGHLDGLVARAKKAGVRARGLLLTEGSPHERIVAAAKTQRADVVVMGTHGRTGVGRFFLGSVAERVVTLSPCPVMTVRGKEAR